VETDAIRFDDGGKLPIHSKVLRSVKSYGERMRKLLSLLIGF